MMLAALHRHAPIGDTVERRFKYLHLDDGQPWYELRHSLADIPREHG